MQSLVNTGYDRLPLPGGGNTLARWRALADVASVDLSLAKLFEGHTDALAILAELDAPVNPSPRSVWGVWCAEPPTHRVTFSPLADGRVEVTGVKAWCSGAATSSHALVSGWNADGQPGLAAVALQQSGVLILEEDWTAPGMRASATVNVAFQQAVATPVGAPGQYVNRPGFLHGGAGIAACWYGSLEHIVRRMRAGASGDSVDPFRLAHLGAADVILCMARSALRDAAAAIDANPLDSCALATARARLAVEAAAESILSRAARALGAGPLCKEPAFAQAMADLPVFIRQSHAERDQAAHGAVVARLQDSAWTL
ncbi:acyl-CoA dehydrogenase [Achromobacter pestifer]